MKRLAPAAVQDAERAYQTIARAFNELLPCKLISLWMCALEHDLLSLRAVEPISGPYAHALTPDQCLSGLTLERHTITDFDLASEKPGSRYGRDDLRYHATNRIAELELTRMISVPVFDTYNKHHIRMIINLFPSVAHTAIGFDEISDAALQVAYIADSVLDRNCLDAAAAASFLAGLGKSPQEFASDVCRMMRKAIQCEGVTLFMVRATGDRLEATGTTGIEWFVPRDERFYEFGKGITGKVWKSGKTKLSTNALDAPDRKAKSAELVESAKQSCLWVPLLNSNESVVGMLRCQNKRIEIIGGSASFSDDDVAVCEAVGQVILPHLAVSIADEHRRAAVERLAHELLLPATAIRNAVQLMREALQRKGTNPKQLFAFDYLSDVGSWSDLMIRLVNNADFYGTRHDTATLEPTRTKLMADVIAPAVRQIEMLLKNRGFSHSKIEYSRLEQVPPLWVDRNKMQQVMFNLLSNAIKYAFADPNAFRIQIDGQRQGPEFRIDFRDWGEGIPTGFEERIFEEGYRPPRTAGRAVTGQGFGLWIVRMIITAHGGRVNVTSRHMPTQISIYLPERLAQQPTNLHA